MHVKFFRRIEMSACFEDIIDQVKALPVKKLSVCVAQDKNVLEACRLRMDFSIGGDGL